MTKEINIDQFKNKTEDEIAKTDLSSFDTESLKQALQDGLQITARNLVLLGCIWRELERKGINLDHLKNGIARYIPLIGSGKLKASLVIEYAGQQTLIKELSLLPAEVQEKISKTKTVTLATKNKEGEIVEDVVDLSTIHARHYPIIFDAGKINNFSQQRKIIEQERNNKRKKRNTPKVRSKKVHFDKANKAFKVGNIMILTDDIIKTLSEISGHSIEELNDIIKIPKPNDNE